MPRIYTEDLKELPDIPDRFGEKNWRRFEPIIKEVINRFPEPVVFVPKTSLRSLLSPVFVTLSVRSCIRQTTGKARLTRRRSSVSGLR